MSIMVSSVNFPKGRSGCYIMTTPMVKNLVKFGETSSLYERLGKQAQRFAKCAGFAGRKDAKLAGWTSDPTKVVEWVDMPESCTEQRQAYEDKIREALVQAGATQFVRVLDNNNKESGEYYIIPDDLQTITVEGRVLKVR